MNNIYIYAKRIIAIICIVALFFATSFWMSKVQEDAYAATGSLISKNGKWYGDSNDDNASITVGWSGWYTITVTAGAPKQSHQWRHYDPTYYDSKPVAKVTVNTYLSKGDVLKFRYYKHGAVAYDKWWENSSGNDKLGTGIYDGGCDAPLMFLNGVPLVGAGQKLEIKNDYFGCGSFNCNLGGGAGFNHRYSRTPGYPAEVPIKYGLFELSSCYLDTTRATLLDLVESTQLTGSFVVQAVANTVDDSYDAQIAQANYQKEMVQQLKAISEKIGSGSGSESTYPTVTVCENQNFSFVIGAYDDMPSGSSPGGECSVVNSNVGDGVIEFSGKFTIKGNYSVLISGKKFIVHVIESPSPNNVSVILS